MILGATIRDILHHGDMPTDDQGDDSARPGTTLYAEILRAVCVFFYY